MTRSPRQSHAWLTSPTLGWITKAISAMLIYVMIAQLCDDLRTWVQPNRSFAQSLKQGSHVVLAIVNGLLLPIVLFLAFFLVGGRRIVQSRLALVGIALTGSTVCAYFVVSFRPALPNGGVDFEIVASAGFFFFLWLGLALGVLLRLRRIRPYKWEAHPRCAGCGYDLSGNVSGRCPECGKSLGEPA